MAGPEPVRNAGVLRRFGAMLYDTLLVIALAMLVTTALLPFTGGEAILAERVGGAVEYGYRALLLLLVIAFFGLSWTWRGQTLGMTAWRLKVQREDGTLLRWSDALLRMAGASVSLAALGLGYFWIWIDRDGLAWHDRWTRTRVVVLPKVRR